MGPFFMTCKYDMRYLLDHSVAFIHNPKTAGTSITEWLDFNFKTVKGRKHGNYKDVEEFFPKTVFTFGVVRNPWERLASWYAFSNRNENFQDWLQTRLSMRNSMGMSFRPNINWSNNWYYIGTPQADWLGDNINCVLRFENLEDDFYNIQKLLGCNRPLPKLNSSNYDNYKDLYTNDLVEFVRDIFIKDVIRYNYDFKI